MTNDVTGGFRNRCALCEPLDPAIERRDPRTKAAEPPARLTAPFAPCACRLAGAIVGMAAHPTDTRTLHEWGRAIGVSRGTVRGWCLVCGVRPKSALTFARGLRAFLQARRVGLTAGDLLDFADRRTYQKFAALTGIDRIHELDTHLAAVKFCESQSYLRNPVVIDAVVAIVRLCRGPL
jgi:hypothetical protein